MSSLHSRRRVLAGLSALAAGFVAPSACAEPPIETTSVRLPKWEGGAYCWAGNYMAGELLHAEGFTDVRYVQGDPKLDQADWIARGDTDFSVNYLPIHVASIDSGVPIKVLAGLHSGCLELIANDKIRTIGDLRGKRVGMFSRTSSTHVMVALMAAYVGIDPSKEIEWVVEKDNLSKHFIAGSIDAFFGHSALAPGAARQQSRPHDRQHDDRQAVVAAFLLHDFCDCGLCEQISGGNQARIAGDLQVGRPVRN